MRKQEDKAKATRKKLKKDEREKQSSKNLPSRGATKLPGGVHISDEEKELFLDHFYQGEFLSEEKYSKHKSRSKLSESGAQLPLEEDEKELFLRAINEGIGEPKYGKKDLKNVDKNKRRARKRGAIDAKLDLHGMYVEDAINLLYKFLEREKKRGSRTILIVHGKGAGILKNAVWSLMDSLPCVLDFQIAQERLGGDGAILVRIGRKIRN